MKTRATFTLTLLIFFSLSSVNGLTQEAPPEYIVRVIYFVPNDLQADADIDRKLDTVTKKVQKFYADQMEAHGFERKTFRLETTPGGKVVVHHVKGKFNDAYYARSDLDAIVLTEVSEHFESPNTILFLTVEDTNPGDFGGRGGGNSLNGFAVVTEDAVSDEAIRETDGWLVAHELGHAFGLQHDHREDRKTIFTLPLLEDPMVSSFSAAQWLNRHRYFNATHHGYNQDSRVEMLPPILANPPQNIRLRFEVSDPDGLHQAQVFSPQADSLIAYQALEGEDVTVDVFTPELLGINKITCRVMDRHGNFMEYEFDIDIADVLPPELHEVVSIPDPILASTIKYTLGVEDTQRLRRSDLLKLKSLIFEEGEAITNLTGLEEAINLKELNVHNQGRLDITPLASLSKLETLWIEDSLIDDITPVSGLSHLKFLYFSNTQIRDLRPIESLTQLQYLTLRENPIQDFSPIANLTNLQELSIQNSQIDDLSPIAGLNHLETLRLLNTQISDIRPIESLTQLRNLELNGNPIQDFSPIANLTNLQELDIGNTQDFGIALDIGFLVGLTKLEYLILPQCLIDDITLLNDMIQLKSLALSGNIISDITSLTSLTELQYLNLSYNRIEDVHPLANLINLEYLFLVGNPIADRTPLRALQRKNRDVEIYLQWNEPLPTPKLVEDVNGDGEVNIQDLVTVAAALGQTGENDADVNGDGEVNIQDLVAVAAALGQTTAAPSIVHQQTLAHLTAADVQHWLIQAQQLDLTDPITQRGVLLLQHFLAVLTPQETILLANYPNPFNPETWIPYQLAKPADVTLTIYDIQGRVVRDLDLGHQRAGMYHGRSRAAYWDGKNVVGEPVASGVYFYTLTAGDFTATRKMLIRK